MLTFADGINAAITDVKSSSNQFRVTWREVKKGRQYKLLVQPLSTQSPIPASLRIETNFPPETPRVLIVPVEVN